MDPNRYLNDPRFDEPQPEDVKDSLTTGDSCPDDIDLWVEDDEPEHVCTCNVMHDDLEHAENLCSACGLMIADPWGPAYVSAAQQQKDGN